MHIEVSLHVHHLRCYNPPAMDPQKGFLYFDTEEEWASVLLWPMYAAN